MSKIPENMLGPFYMVLSCLFFASAWGVMRQASFTMDPVLIVFYRNLIGFLMLTPFYVRHGKGAFKTDHLPIHFIRGMASLVGTYSLFYAVSVTPLATVVAITYVAPVVAVAGAVIILGETIKLRRAISMLVGFVGVLIVVRPFGMTLTSGTYAAMLGTLSIAVALLTVKRLTKTDESETIVAYSFGLILPPSIVVALLNWQWPTLYELALMLAMGVGVFYAQIFMTRAFKISDATSVLPLDFVRLLAATAIGIFFFGEPFDVWVTVGAAIILASTVYTAHREAVTQRARITKNLPEVPPGG